MFGQPCRYNHDMYCQERAGCTGCEIYLNKKLQSVKAAVSGATHSGSVGVQNSFLHTTNTIIPPVRHEVAIGSRPFLHCCPILSPIAASTFYTQLRRAIDRTNSNLSWCKRGDDGELVFPCEYNLSLVPPMDSKSSSFASSPSHNHLYYSHHSVA